MISSTPMDYGTLLIGSAFSDPDQDGHQATQWQISNHCIDFSSPINDTWVQHENWYKGVNTLKNDNLLDVNIYNLIPNSSYCWRVRYRDKSLGWSEWSDPISFVTDTVFNSWKLYPNPLFSHSTLNIPHPETHPVSIDIYNSSGQCIRKHKNVFPPVFALEKGTLDNGVYYLHIMDEADRLGVVKFVVATER